MAYIYTMAYYSAIKKNVLHPVKLGCPHDLLWPRECSKSDPEQVLSLDLKWLCMIALGTVRLPVNKLRLDHWKVTDQQRVASGASGVPPEAIRSQLAPSDPPAKHRHRSRHS